MGAMGEGSEVDNGGAWAVSKLVPGFRLGALKCSFKALA